MRLSPSPRIKAYRAAAGLGPTSEMDQSRRFDRGSANSGLPPMNGHSQTAPAKVPIAEAI
jgi:hypothetical protein